MEQKDITNTSCSFAGNVAGAVARDLGSAVGQVGRENTPNSGGNVSADLVGGSASNAGRHLVAVLHLDHHARTNPFSQYLVNTQGCCPRHTEKYKTIYLSFCAAF